MYTLRPAGARGTSAGRPGTLTLGPVPVAFPTRSPTANRLTSVTIATATSWRIVRSDRSGLMGIIGATGTSGFADPNDTHRLGAREWSCSPIGQRQPVLCRDGRRGRSEEARRGAHAARCRVRAVRVRSRARRYGAVLRG